MINVAHAGMIADATPIAEVLASAAAFVVGAFGAIAVIAFVLSGIIYLFASGNEQLQQKAKRATFYAVIGVVVALGSIIIIRTLAALFG